MQKVLKKNEKMYYNEDRIENNSNGGSFIMEREYNLRICGNNCTIISTENEEFVRRLAKEVEEKINEIYKENERISLALAAIFTSMGLCEELMIVKESADNLRGQLKTYLDDAQKATDDKEEALREIERLRREIDALRARLANNR